MPRPPAARTVYTPRFILILAGGLLVLVGIVLLIVWFFLPQVTVTQLSTGPVVQAFYATGTVRPVREFPIKANTAGILIEVLVDKGDRVQAGQVLARVNDASLTYAAAKAQADLTEKEKRLDPKTSPVLMEFDEKLRINAERQVIADREFNRVDLLTKTNAVSIADRDLALDKIKQVSMETEAFQKQRDAKVLELERERATAQAAVDTANWELDQQTMKAPIDGAVLDRPTSQGTRVALNDIVMRIADVRPVNLVMRAQVDEEDVTHCHTGQLVRMSLYAFAGQPIVGKVKQIYDEADTDRRTFEVDVTFDNILDGLSSGMTGELAFIESEKQEANVLPSTALQSGKIFVVRSGKLEDANATVGLRSVERIEIVGGIQPGDAVVVSPRGDLKPGQRVRTKVVDPASATPLSNAADPNHSAANLKAF